MKCPICNYTKYRYVSYAEEMGIVERHGYCKRCGYTIEQTYSPIIEGFTPPIKRGGRVYKNVYIAKNVRKRKHMKRKHNIKYGNKDYMLMFI